MLWCFGALMHCCVAAARFRQSKKEQCQKEETRIEVKNEYVPLTERAFPQGEPSDDEGRR